MGQTESAEAQSTTMTTAEDSNSNSNSSDPTSLESVLAGCFLFLLFSIISSRFISHALHLFV